MTEISQPLMLALPPIRTLPDTAAEGHLRPDQGTQRTCEGMPSHRWRQVSLQNPHLQGLGYTWPGSCLLYTSDAADDLLCVDLGGRRIIKKKKKKNILSNYC